MTGYQVTESQDKLVQKVLGVMDGDKHLSFVQFSLRSARTIFQKGGTVTPLLQERVFNMKFDNRRQIISNVLEQPLFYSSKPHADVAMSLISRKLASLGTARFNVFFPSNNSSEGKSYQSLLKRMLVRALLQKPELFGLDSKMITRTFIVEFLSKYGIRCLPDYVSKQKHHKFLPNVVPKTVIITKILDSIQQDYAVFSPSQMYRN